MGGMTASETIINEVTSRDGVQTRVDELHDQGRIDYHPVFPGKPGYAARRIASDEDVRDVIALLRINYDRSAARPR
jgi:hypothetical protein